jgi:hypothetical protein
VAWRSLELGEAMLMLAVTEAPNWQAFSEVSERKKSSSLGWVVQERTDELAGLVLWAIKDRSWAILVVLVALDQRAECIQGEGQSQCDGC